MLHEFIDSNRDEIIGRCRAKVAARALPAPTDVEIDHGVPVFLSQLTEALRLGVSSDPEIARIARRHGHDLLRQGYTLSQVVHDYGDVCQSVTELAVEMGASISSTDFGMLNQCLDDAIAGAVTEYGLEQHRSTLEEEGARGTQRLGFLAHELGNLTNTAILAFDVVKTGNVGVAGSTGAVLQRSLAKMRTLIARSLDEIRLTQEVREPVGFLLSDFIYELEPAATLDARDRGVTLTVLPIAGGVAIKADRAILAAAVTNVLQNAFKYTRPHTHVTLRTSASVERVLIEVEDECGGLQNDDVGGLSRSLEQGSSDPRGMGLGLSFCRWAVEANDGRISARIIPGRGCVFTIALPRVPREAVEPAGVHN